MLISIPALADNGRIEKGYSSPEDAFKAYFEAFQKNDVSGMIETFAIESYVENTDARAYVEGRGGINPLYEMESIPVSNDYIRDLQYTLRQNKIAEDIYQQYLMYSWYFGGMDDNCTPFNSFRMDNGGVDRYMEVFSGNGFPESVRRAEFIRFMDRDEVVTEEVMEKARLNLLRRSGIGTDDICFMIVLIEINGEEYVQCMDCVKYGKRWYNLRANGNMAMMCSLSSYMGGLMPLSFEPDIAF